MDGGIPELVDQRIDPHRISREIEQAGTAWADHAHAASLLEKTEDIVLSTLILAMRLGPDGKRVSWEEARHQAKASEDYQSHVYAMTEARYKANKARVRFDAMKAKFEAMRTAESTRRAELITLGRQ